MTGEPTHSRAGTAACPYSTAAYHANITRGVRCHAGVGFLIAFAERGRAKSVAKKRRISTHPPRCNIGHLEKHGTERDSDWDWRSGRQQARKDKTSAVPLVLSATCRIR